MESTALGSIDRPLFLEQPRVRSLCEAAERVDKGRARETSGALESITLADVVQCRRIHAHHAVWAVYALWRAKKGAHSLKESPLHCVRSIHSARDAPFPRSHDVNPRNKYL